MAGEILLVIDNPEVSYLLCRYAEECGLQASTVTAAEVVCVLAQAIRPQAIILEIQGKSDRLKMLHDLKTRESTRDIPVIVYCDQENDLVDLPEVAAHLCQPVLYGDFIDVLGQVRVLPAPYRQQGTHLMQSESVSQHTAAIEQSGWSIRMADAVMARLPHLSIDWRYEAGVLLTALVHLWQKTGDDRYIDYVKANVDAFVEADGSIRTYSIEEYNLDQIDEGKVLFPLFKRTGDERYKLAAYLLRQQLEQHPRTSAGGFWHKLIYPHQMWLDGIYMAAPFYAEFGQVFDEPAAYDDVALQISLIDEHTRDARTGLLYHGWDESKSHSWADPQTGRSSSFWGRAIGWYLMALVDVLDYLPERHPQRGKVIAILEKTVAALASVQDPATGTWYQVLDQGGRAGNYLEASASCMFVYAIAKGVRKGYLGKDTLDMVKKGYAGILSEFISVDGEGQPRVNKICSVAGLDQNRDGTFEYYIGEKVVSDDYKGIGPFIMASIEMENVTCGL